VPSGNLWINTSWSVISDYLYEIENQGIKTQSEQGKAIVQSLLEGRIGQQHTANFIQAMKEIKELYPVEEYLKALREKDIDKLHSMAPSKTTSNYGLIFSLSRWAKDIDDYIDAMLIFKEFTAIDDEVNREENFTSAVTIIGGKLEESNEILKALTNSKFLKELGPKIRDIPKLSTLNEQMSN